MPDRLSMHAPPLVNTLGHCAGVLIFGILLYYLVVDWRRDPAGRSVLPCIAATLALLWNAGSLIGLATSAGDAVSDAIVAISFSVLSLLPAVLLHISLGASRRALSVSGYVISSLAVVLHITDLVTGAPRFHYAAILLITIGFGCLTVLTLGCELAGHEKDGSGKRLAGAMVLFLLAISFVHFRADHNTGGWSGEAALHHAAIPLALFVLLQDYRFLLLDAFVRFLMNSMLAAMTVWIALALETRFSLLSADPDRKPFFAALAFAGACLLISLFAFARGRAQRALTKSVFLRKGAAHALAEVRLAAATATSEAGYLDNAIAVARQTFSALRAEVADRPPAALGDLRHAVPVVEHLREPCPAWVQAVAPVRLARGNSCFLYLGARTGRRRYLSEDLELLDRMTEIISEQIERMRDSEMQALVAQAELRALQAQINPHFFFNALNTLYGAIPRDSATARKLVLNLAELFRMSFASERSSIRIEEELRIVRAYLEIEQLRLGSKLHTEISVDDAALAAEVPVLTIQPLIENGIKHGVASRPDSGFIRLRISARDESVAVEVSNSGVFQLAKSRNGGTGTGLANVRRRLALCFGERSGLDITTKNDVTTVRFSVPLKVAAARA